jgi:hypothetical protein
VRIPLEIQKRACIYVLMASLLALQAYVSFAAHRQIRIDSLSSGDYAIVRTLERANDNGLLPGRGGRDAASRGLFPDFTSMAALVCAGVDVTGARSLFGALSLPLAHPLAADVRSDVVLRI